MFDTSCPYCAGTGKRIDGSKCDCGVTLNDIQIPSVLNIPTQYQGVEFSESFVRDELKSYARYMESLIHELVDEYGMRGRNVLICSPPNTGKTIFAYTVIERLYARGILISDVMDLLQVRSVMYDLYSQESEELVRFNKSKVIFIKIPMDLPNKWAETMSSIIERRTRLNQTTIYLYSGTKEDLIAQDKFYKFRNIVGDGSFNSLEVKSWEVRRKE